MPYVLGAPKQVWTGELPEGVTAGSVDDTRICWHVRFPWGTADTIKAELDALTEAPQAKDVPFFALPADIKRRLAETVPGFPWQGWFAGRPLLITENDRQLGLYNGDTGVVVDAGGALRCAFERRGEVVHVSPSRLAAVETLYAMTIHKSQGSQFGQVVVVLPDEASPILTRELLYTAVTRAERGVTVVGTEAAVRAAVSRPVARASGLRGRLWGNS